MSMFGEFAVDAVKTEIIEKINNEMILLLESNDNKDVVKGLLKALDIINNTHY